MSSREEFEKWVRGLNLTPEDPVAVVAWMGWKAATERAATVCDAIEERYMQEERGKWPEMRTDAEAGAGQCGYEIREGNE